MQNEIHDIDPNVLSYYSRNWEKIANCYNLDSFGLPVDSAWYRREIYREFLEVHKPKSVIDIGSGGGTTVLDALQLGIVAQGFEPVSELCGFARNLIEEAGFSGEAISNDDASILDSLQPNSVDAVAMLSVIPHIPLKDWPQIHSGIHNVLKPNGKAIIAYRNSLFDMFTLNRFTAEFFEDNFYSFSEIENAEKEKYVIDLQSALPYHNMPERNFTHSDDKSFGALERPKNNPLEFNQYIGQFGFKVSEMQFCNFHCKPPIFQQNALRDRVLKHQLELNYRKSWQGNFMASMFVAILEKS